MTGRHAPGPRTVCVVASGDDVTADHVVHRLNRRGTPVLRLDPAAFPREVSFDAVFTTREGWQGTLRSGRRTAALQDIGSVFWWHHAPPRLTGQDTPRARWADQEAIAGLGGVLAALPCLHVNHPATGRASSSKAAVLTAAVRCGLEVPATWIGSHPQAARAFQAAAPGGVVAKSLTAPVIEHPDGTRSTFHTTPVTGPVPETVAHTSHQFQHAVAKDYEVRLTVVGTEMFAARIDAHSQAARADYRADPDALTYQATQVPRSVRYAVHRLMTRFRLNYATLDLLVENGRFLLVDLNNLGQYGWIEHALPDLAISDALAALLAGGCRQPGLTPPVPA